MARKSTSSTDSNGGTATAETPKNRVRKSPKMKAESLTVKALNAIEALGCMADRLTAPQRKAIVEAVNGKLADIKLAFDEPEADAEEPEPFSLPD